MIVAVTGGTGFVGASLVRAHLAKGDEVRVLSRGRSSPVTGEARMVQGDLTMAQEFVGADILYHCAGELRR